MRGGIGPFDPIEFWKFMIIVLFPIVLLTSWACAWAISKLDNEIKPPYGLIALAFMVALFFTFITSDFEPFGPGEFYVRDVVGGKVVHPTYARNTAVVQDSYDPFTWIVGRNTR